jgi:tetratricopeptide (TPR) repeat protein
MARPDKSPNRPVQPSLSDLFDRYLREQAGRRAAGLAGADTTSEVVLFEAVPTEPVDAELAWREAVAVGGWFYPDSKTQECLIPPDWAAIVTSQEPVAALAFSFGNYPQLVRSLHTLLQATDLRSLLPKDASSPPAPTLREWASASAREQQYPHALLAVGALRLARQFDNATELLQRHRGTAPAAWQGAWANEAAALAWHRGQAQLAADLWKQQDSSVPVLFNRGMSALFLGKSAEARPLLAQAVDQLAEDDGWHHLGRLYLALAETRG